MADLLPGCMCSTKRRKRMGNRDKINVIIRTREREENAGRGEGEKKKCHVQVGVGQGSFFLARFWTGGGESWWWVLGRKELLIALLPPARYINKAHPLHATDAVVRSLSLLLLTLFPRRLSPNSIAFIVDSKPHQLLLFSLSKLQASYSSTYTTNAPAQLSHLVTMAPTASASAAPGKKAAKPKASHASYQVGDCSDACHLHLVTFLLTRCRT